jgi:hypothetical protein
MKWLKVKVLSSSPSTAKKKKKIRRRKRIKNKDEFYTSWRDEKLRSMGN